MDDDNQIIDQEAWRQICNLRRKKIKYEYKTNIYQKDMMDKVNLIETLKRNKEVKEAMFQHNTNLIVNLEEQDFYYDENPKVNSILFCVNKINMLYKEKVFD